MIDEGKANRHVAVTSKCGWCFLKPRHLGYKFISLGPQGNNAREGVIKQWPRSKHTGVCSTKVSQQVEGGLPFAMQEALGNAR